MRISRVRFPPDSVPCATIARSALLLRKPDMPLAVVVVTEGRKSRIDADTNSDTDPEKMLAGRWPHCNHDTDPVREISVIGPGKSTA